jgi:hypothetical protein
MSKKHLATIAKWMKDFKNAKEAKVFLKSFVTPFGFHYFTFDKTKDGFLFLGSAGNNKCFRDLVLDMFGTDILEKVPDRDIFEHDEDDEWHNGRLDTDKLEKYQKEHKKPYLDLDILTIYEDGVYEGEITADLSFYVISFSTQNVYEFLYHQERDGDVQEVTFKDSVRFIPKGATTKQTAKQSISKKPKFISYIFTCGGDAGWRFSNGPEWHSMQGMALFPAGSWNRKQIQNFMNSLDKRLSTATGGCSTLASLLDVGERIIGNAFKKNNISMLEDYKYKEDGWDREGNFTTYGAKALQKKDITIIGFNDLPKKETSNV